MKKIAVLGANGYIARNLIHVMQKEYSDCKLSLYGIEEMSADNLDEYIQVDMTDKESIQKIDLNCDIVFMLVGRTGSENGFEQYDAFIDANEKALLNLLSEYKRQESNAKIIFPSTRLVYKGRPEPRKEDAEKEFKTVYAINKYACEQYLEQFNRIYDVQYCIFRICIPYGTLVSGASSYGTAEFMLSRALNGENISLYGDGTVRRTITYMGDLCRTMMEGALSDGCVNDVFNIGGEDYSLYEMAKLIAKKYDVGVDFVPWPKSALKIESGDTVFDSEKLDSIIGSFIKVRFADWINQVVPERRSI